MKPIKFDLPLNGIRIATLEQLEDNLTPEIFVSFRSGKLAKWLRARSLDEKAGAVDALLAANVQDEVQLFIKLCEVFDIGVDEDIASDMIEEYKASLASKNTATEEIAKTQQIELVEKDDENQADESSLSMALVKVNDINEEQLKLLEEGNEKQRAELAALPDISEKVQKKLLLDKAESVLVALASNPFLLDELQAKLAITGAPAVREALASNQKLNEKQQNYLATAGDWNVKSKLSENPSLTPAIQSILLDDEYYSVREGLARNSSLDMACQTRLIKDENINARIALASNPILARELQQQMLSRGDNEVIVALAKNPSLSEALMAKLAVSYSSVKESLAGNPSLTLELQAVFTNTGSIDERLALYDNPSLDESLKARITESFTERDLIFMKRDLEYAENSVESRDEEEREADSKCRLYDADGLFGSQKKQDELQKAANRALERCNKASREAYTLKCKVGKLEAIIKLQTKKDTQENDGFSSFFSRLEL